MPKVKVNFQLPEDVVNKIDKKANELCVSRTACVTMLLVQALQIDDTMDVLKRMVELNGKENNEV